MSDGNKTDSQPHVRPATGRGHATQEMAVALTVDGEAWGLTETLAALTIEEPDVAHPGTQNSSPLLQVIDADHYTAGEHFGAGGMGAIRKVQDRRLRRHVLIKELVAHRQLRASARRRFEREIFISAALQHPGIVTVLEGGCWPSGDPFLAMQEIQGDDFDGVISGLNTLEERLARLQVVVDVANAMAYAHARGVIHRDLKPANVLVGAFGEVVVIDWGIAKVIGEAEMDVDDLVPVAETENAHVTRAGAVIGTLAYMPPEQAAGDVERLDARADVYGIGTILYHLLAGRPPLQGKISHLLFAAGKARPDPIEEVVAGIPSALVSIVNKAMAFNPEERYPDAGALADDLQLFTTGQLVQSHVYTPGELVRRWIQRNRALVASIGVALVITIAVVSVSFQQVLSANEALEANNMDLIAEREKTRALNMGTLVLHGTPPGAAIVINGTPQAETLRGLGSGVNITHDPSDGDHPLEILITAPNHHPTTRHVVLKPRATTHVDAIILDAADDGAPAGMVRIPGGTFVQSPDFFADLKDATAIRTTHVDAFDIDIHEVTYADYRACVDAGICTTPRGLHSDNPAFNWGAADRDRHPINGVDWAQANTFCAWMGKRLPTETEWEKSARGQDTRRNAWGNAPASCEFAVMNHDDGPGCGAATTAPVGSKPKGASGMGVFDVAGNVAEWTSDWYGPFDAGATHNPQGPNKGERRVVRGGSYYPGM